MKKFETPEMEIKEFAVVDIITESEYKTPDDEL